MNLILQLKKEHQQMLRILALIQMGLDGKRKDFEPGEELSEMNQILSAHLELEDKLLYPKFQKSDILQVRQLGESFANEMADITKRFMTFMKNYGDKETNSLIKDSKFKQTFKQIYSEVNKRVIVEENLLFPAYTQYFEK